MTGCSLLSGQDNQKPDSEETYEKRCDIIDPDSTYIDEDVEIGIDTVVYPSTIIEGKTK